MQIQLFSRPLVRLPISDHLCSDPDIANLIDERPLPSCLGGGDLDGDEYNVIPLNELPEFWIDSRRIQEPGLYPAAQRRELDRPCTMADVGDFVMEYITSDVRCVSVSVSEFSSVLTNHTLGSRNGLYQVAYSR